MYDKGLKMSYIMLGDLINKIIKVVSAVEREDLKELESYTKDIEQYLNGHFEYNDVGSPALIESLQEQCGSLYKRRRCFQTTLFRLAIKLGNLKVVKFFIEKDLSNVRTVLFKPDCKGADGYLSDAVDYQRIEVLKYLTSFKEVQEIIEKNNLWYRLLKHANITGNKEMASYLLENMNIKFDVKETDYHGRPLLHYATLFPNNIDMINKLISRGLNVNVRDDQGLTVLLTAASTENIQHLDYWLSKKEFSLNDRGNLNENVLSEAVYYRKPSMVRHLLKIGAYVDIKLKGEKTYCMIRYRHATPANQTEPQALDIYNAAIDLMRLASSQKFESTVNSGATNSTVNIKLNEIFKKLEQGLNGRQVDTDNTALHLALLNKHYDLSLELVTRGARTDIKNKNDVTSADLIFKIEDKALRSKIMDALKKGTQETHSLALAQRLLSIENKMLCDTPSEESNKGDNKKLDESLKSDSGNETRKNVINENSSQNASATLHVNESLESETLYGIKWHV